MNIKTKDIWMKISGATGLLVFTLVHVNFFDDYTYIAAITQLCVNAFVFVVGINVFPTAKGKRKFLSFFWVAIPPIMTSITIYRIFM